MTQTASANEQAHGHDQNDLTAQAVVVTADDLPLHCPTSKTPLWNMHPRVFLDIVDTGSARCPYCGTTYTLAPGTHIHRHGN